MRLRNALSVASLSALLLTVNASALPQAADAKAEIDEGREMIRAARLDMIQTELRLNNDEGGAFWPVYFAYSAERDAIQDRNAAIIAEYLQRYDSADLTDAYADELMQKHVRIKQDLLNLQKAYIPKFRAVLPGLKVVRLFQLENKVAAEIDAQLAVVIPLAEAE